MASVDISWSCTLGINSNNVQTVTAQGTATLNGCTHGHTLNWAEFLKIGVVYYDGDNVPLAMDGSTLPSGEVYSRYASLQSQGRDGSGTTITLTATNHDGAAYCRTSPPPGAVTAAYRYYAAANANTLCPGAGFQNKLGPVSPSWGAVTI